MAQRLVLKGFDDGSYFFSVYEYIRVRLYPGSCHKQPPQEEGKV